MLLLRSFLDRAVEWLAVLALAGLAAVIMGGVVMRELGDPLIWTDEVSRFLMVWLAVLGWMVASRRRAHIRIRYFHDMLPPRWWTGAEVAMQAAVVAFGAGIAWFSVDLVSRNLDMEATTVPVSMAWMYASMVLAGLMTAGQGLADLAEALMRPRTASGPAGASPIAEGVVE